MLGKNYHKIAAANSLITISVIAVIYKILQFIIVWPQVVTDSNDYLVISNKVFDFSSDTFGLRTPVYPLIIKIVSLFSASLNLIVIVQLLFGMASFILLYLIVREIESSIAALIASLLLLFSPTALYDSVISTESLTIFLNILFLFVTIKAFITKKTLFYILSSITLTVLIFTRPQYLVYIPAITIYFVLQKSSFKAYFIVITPFIISIIWICTVYSITGIFSMTTLTGYNLINHTGKFIEKGPAEYEPLKSIYITQRDKDIQLRGSQSGTIWRVRDTLQKNMKLNKTELSIVLNKINIYLILNYPLEYLRSVWSSLRLALIVPDDDFRIVNNGFLFRFLLPVYQLIIGVGFASGIYLVFYLRKNKNHSLYTLMFFLVMANLAASVIFDYGTNGRFFAPSYFILFIWSATFIINFKVLNKS